MRETKYTPAILLDALRRKEAGMTWGAIAACMGLVSGAALSSAARRYKSAAVLERDGYGWALHVQDWSGRRIGIGDADPSVEIVTFATKEEADAEKERRRSHPDVVLCVSSIEVAHQAKMQRRAWA